MCFRGEDPKVLSDMYGIGKDQVAMWKGCRFNKHHQEKVGKSRLIGNMSDNHGEGDELPVGAEDSGQSDLNAECWEEERKFLSFVARWKGGWWRRYGERECK